MNCESKNDKLERALKCALHVNGKPDDALHRKVLYSWKEERVMKIRKYKAAIAVVAVIAGISVISGSVYAAVTGSNLLEEFNNNGNQISKEAEKLVDREPQIIKTESPKQLQYVNYTVDEIVCDDYTIYARVTLTPKDADKYTLLGDNIFENSLERSVSTLRIDGLTKGTLGEYAKRGGREIIHVSCDFELSSMTAGGGSSSWFRYGKNGEVYCYTSIEDTPGQKEYTEKLCIHEFEDFDCEKPGGAEYLTVAVSNKSSVNTRKEYKTVEDTLDYGIKVDRISAIITELGVYLTIECTSQIEYDGYSGCIDPRIFDEDGNEIDVMEGGHGTGGGIGKCVWKLKYGSIDMSKMYIGFLRTYNEYHEEIDESVIGPYAIEEVK